MSAKDAQGLKSLLAINFLSGSASGILLLALPLYALSLRAGAVELGLISGMSGIGRMLIILPSGLWVDRNGTRWLFVGSSVLCAVLTLTVPWIDVVWQLMGIMFFQGMAQSVGFMTLQAGFLKRMRHMDASQAGWQRSATQFGFYLIGPLAGGFMLEGNHYIPVFIMTSVLFLAGVVIVLLRRSSGIMEAKDSLPMASGSDFSRLFRLLGNRDLRFVLAIEMLGAAIFMTFRTFMAPVALDVLKLPVQLVSWLVITQGTTAMCSLFWGARIVKNRSPVWCFCMASLLVITGTGLLATANGLLVFWIGTFFYGIGTGLLSYSSLTRLMQVEGEKGKIAALFSLSIAIGNIIGPIAGGCIGEIMGLQATFFTPVALMLMVLAVVIWQIMRNCPGATKRRHADNIEC